MNDITFLTTNIYFSLLFGSISSSIILIYSRNRTIFNINKKSHILKVFGIIISVTVLSFFISLIAFDISDAKQALLVSFGIVNFITNPNEMEISDIGENNV